MNGVCPVCLRAQRLYDDVMAPHLTFWNEAPVTFNRWTECGGGGRPPLQRTDEPVDDSSATVGTVTEVGMINLLACAVTEHEWTVLGAHGAALAPIDVATALVCDMLRGSAANGPEAEKTS